MLWRNNAAEEKISHHKPLATFFLRIWCLAVWKYFFIFLICPLYNNIYLSFTCLRKRNALATRTWSYPSLGRKYFMICAACLFRYDHPCWYDQLVRRLFCFLQSNVKCLTMPLLFKGIMLLSTINIHHLQRDTLPKRQRSRLLVNLLSLFGLFFKLVTALGNYILANCRH